MGNGPKISSVKVVGIQEKVGTKTHFFKSGQLTIAVYE
jgi:hypothetical protein